MCYIILPRPELIYYVQHHLYAHIGAIDYNCNLSAGDFDSFFLKYFGVENPDPSQLLHLLQSLNIKKYDYYIKLITYFLIIYPHAPMYK